MLAQRLIGSGAYPPVLSEQAPALARFAAGLERLPNPSVVTLRAWSEFCSGCGSQQQESGLRVGAETLDRLRLLQQQDCRGGIAGIADG